MTITRAGAASAPAVSEQSGPGTYTRNGDHLALHDAGDGANVTLGVGADPAHPGLGFGAMSFGVFEPLSNVEPGSTITDVSFGVTFSADFPNSGSTFLQFFASDSVTGALVLYQSSIATASTAGTTFTAPLRAAVSAAAIFTGAVVFQFGFNPSSLMDVNATLTVDHVWMDVTWTPSTAPAAAPSFASLRLRQHGGGAQPALRLRQDGGR